MRDPEKRRAAVRGPRKPNLIATLSLISVAVIAGWGAPAAAGNSVHKYEETWNLPSGSEPEAQAVDSFGNVYVYNRGFRTVTRYDRAGNPALFSKLGTHVIDGKGTDCPNTPADCDRVPQGRFFPAPTTGFSRWTPTIAVDTSGGPADGYIYVENPGSGTENSVIEVFAPTGEYLGEI